jgi:hypothetical protein
MRENPDGFPSSPSASRAAAPFPVCGWACLKSFSPQRLGVMKNKVTAGLNPADPATMVVGDYTRVKRIVF